MLGQYGRLFNWIVLVGGILGILFPALNNSTVSLTQIFIGLLRPEFTIEYSMKLLLFLAVICTLYIYVVDRIHRSIPITILKTNTIIHFEEGDGSKVSIRREQLLRANRDDVTAYYASFSPTTEIGTVPKSSILMTLFCDANRFGDRMHFKGSDNKGYEVIHAFEKPLPYSWFMPLLPRFFFRGERDDMPNFLKRNLVLRTAEAVYINDHNTPDANIDFIVSEYPQINVRVEIDFGAGRVPSDLKFQRIQSHALFEEPIRTLKGNSRCVVIPRLQKETLRITWTPMEAARTSLMPGSQDSQAPRSQA